ncbi:beta-mannosidase [Paracoccus albus]|uniref:beta-mannosidase n=1 Tax=Paracoccus albus TaxID=3017784 RepID=UPI0022F003E8|nr:glycoside hydrolase family 2 protein [Paracoccus albus]WBU59833.1 glycoside hydrolase family 2 protein [Paracoccus albus]
MTDQQEIDLSRSWELSQIGGNARAAIDFPGDVHSALLNAKVIADLYWRDRETSLDWVHESEWLAERTFTLPDDAKARYVLTLSGVDCHAVVSINGKPVGETENRFLRYDLDITEALVAGQNHLSVHFLSNSTIAEAKSAASPFPIPHIFWNNRLPHYNFLRKPQCDAGWDWNIALSPIGIYGDIRLRRIENIRLDDMMVRQHHRDGRVTVEVELLAHATEPAIDQATLALDGAVVATDVQLWPGQNRVRLSVEITAPRLWWPVGHGAQEFYDLTVSIGDQQREMQIGLREIELDTSPDAIGHRFAFRVNGRDIFMRGANWIPADALPARATKERVADLLDSAVEANMNMIRIWGGGTYEADWFYQMCSERGLLVWQDFMFACNLYPAADRQWLDNVRLEARQQIRRLSAHPCLALWCGDNELVGALNWFDESKADRDRYLAMYDRLNHALEEAIEDEAPDVPWWPSSPSVGRLNFGDGWHDDSSGDMHFWDVWHSAKDFEHYRTVRPRFCSEFGFQSFPSARVIDSFTEPRDRNVSSAVMDVHQRNPGGNSRIVETLARYFRFPDGFENMTWLSQISQALAMKTAIEFWRSNKPRSMGTLYWQLNDTWPVASWASLEYGGGWKALHYAARRFYAPVLISAQPATDGDDIVLWAVNDTPSPVSLTVAIRSVRMSGQVDEIRTAQVSVPCDRAVEVTSIRRDEIAADAFLHFDWTDGGAHVGENEFLPLRPKEYDLGNPNISAIEDIDADGRQTVTLTTDRPALWVSWDHGGDTVWSDNYITLLPGQPRQLSAQRHRHSHLPPQVSQARALRG